MFDKRSRIDLSTCDSKMKGEMEIQQDSVTLWLEKNLTRVNPHDTKPNIIKACGQWYGKMYLKRSRSIKLNDFMDLCVN